MKHFHDSSDDYDSLKEYEQNMHSHWLEDYDPMKEYESHIGCNYNDDYYDSYYDDSGTFKHFQD